MAKATYWQRGESLDYVNSGDAVIDAGTIVVLGTRIGVTGTSINPGETGSLHVMGVFEVAKTATAALTMGEALYFDGTGMTNSATDTTPAGYAAAPATADAVTVFVKILG
jgi:predicted RecA/RadA family phage recombinase